MPPGVRQPKRVRAGAPTEGTPVGVSTRSSKRQLRSVEDEDNEHDGNNGAEDVGNIQFPPENQLNMPQSPLRDWSYPDDAPQDVDGHSNSEEQTQDNDRVPTRRGPRDPRPPTRGIMLDAMTKSMGRRLPIAVEEGKKRPNDPVQAPKLASEAGVVIRAEVPILTHWKEYKKDPDSFENFMGKLSGRLAINRNDDATNDACTDVFKSAIRNKRYKLKKTYFVGVPAEQLSTTSPDPSMSDEQWRKLVAKWINPRNQEIAAKNKQNRGGFKYPQATGSRSYVAHLHAYKQKNKVSELDAVEAFKDCHTSRSKGISDAAKDAISAMENMMAEPISDGEPARSSAQVVSKVLSQDSSNSTFLKNAGL